MLSRGVTKSRKHSSRARVQKEGCLKDRRWNMIPLRGRLTSDNCNSWSGREAGNCGLDNLVQFFIRSIFD